MIKIEFLLYNFSNIKITQQDLLKQYTTKIINTIIPLLNPNIKQVSLAVVMLNLQDSYQLNKIWRKKRYVPVELSFANYSQQYLKKIKESSIILGDIILTPELLQTSQDYKTALIHSLLHLLGYNHNTQANYKKMQKWEKSFLKN